MGLFGKLFKRKDEAFDPSSFGSLSHPPDFSQPPGADPLASSADPYGDAFGKQQADPFAQGGPAPAAPGDPFGQDFSVSREPSSADRARDFGRSLGDPNMGSQGAAPAGKSSDLQLVLERLDTIKAELDSIKQRMMRIDAYLEQRKDAQRRLY